MMKWTSLLAGGFAGPEVPIKRNDEGMRMSFFDKVKGALTSGREELTRQVGRYKNKKLCRVPSRYAPVSLLPVTALAPKKNRR